MRERFDEEFRALLDANNPDTRSIWTFVTRLLRQFRLDNNGITAVEVFSEVYCRGIKKIIKGDIIENPLGWIRVTAFNVISEMQRKHRQEISLDSTSGIESEIHTTSHLDLLLTIETYSENRQALQTAWNKLTPREQEILMLRIVYDLSWREVGERILCDRSRCLSETTARQQGYRALTRLRRLFHTLKPQDPDDQVA